MKAKSFADREIRYTLKAQGQGAGTFNIGPSSGIVKLAKVGIYYYRAPVLPESVPVVIGSVDMERFILMVGDC